MVKLYRGPIISARFCIAGGPSGCLWQHRVIPRCWIAAAGDAAVSAESGRTSREWPPSRGEKTWKDQVWQWNNGGFPTLKHVETLRIMMGRNKNGQESPKMITLRCHQAWLELAAGHGGLVMAGKMNSGWLPEGISEPGEGLRCWNSME